MTYKLIVFDMDGVIFQSFNFWLELHKKLGTYEEGIKLTKKYVKTNYQKLVDEVIGRLWKDKPAKPYFELVNSANYVLGAKETLKELKKKGFKVGIISSGPKHLAQRTQKECGVDYIFTNNLLIENDKIVGSKDINHWPLRHGSKKEPFHELCRLVNVNPKHTIAVGHEDADIEMLKEAGLSIGFNPEQEILKYCNIIIKSNDLRDILPHILQTT